MCISKSDNANPKPTHSKPDSISNNKQLEQLEHSIYLIRYVVRTKTETYAIRQTGKMEGSEVHDIGKAEDRKIG